jgi:Spy/CpxP family protein refolding chaperone
LHNVVGKKGENGSSLSSLNLSFLGKGKDMRNKTKLLKITIALTLLAIFFPVSLVYAQPPGGGFGRGGYGKGNFLRQLTNTDFVKELGLTDEQQAEFRGHLADSSGQMIEMRKLLRDKRLNLRDELRKYDSYPNKIAQITSEIKTLQAQFVDNRVASTLKLKEILTQEQFKKFQEKVDELMEKRRGSRDEEQMQDMKRSDELPEGRQGEAVESRGQDRGQSGGSSGRRGGGSGSGKQGGSGGGRRRGY